MPLTDARAGELARLVEEAHLPLSFTVLENYAEVHDATGEMVAASIKPHLILALNDYPDLLAERAALREALAEMLEHAEHSTPQGRAAFDRARALIGGSDGK